MTYYYYTVTHSQLPIQPRGDFWSGAVWVGEHSFEENSQ